MPSSGVHGAIGLIIASFLENEYAKLGAVIGAVAPDADLIVGTALYAITGKVEIAKKVHRTLSHSLVIHGIIAGIGISFIPWSAPLGNFIIWFAIMMAGHVFLDLSYIAFMTKKDHEQNISPGIMVFAPVSFKKISWWARAFEDRGYNIMLSIDMLLDPIIFYAPILYFAWKFQTNSNIWWVFFITSLALFFVFLIFTLYAMLKDISTDIFSVRLYYPGLPSLCITLSLPLFFQQTIMLI